MQRGSDIEPSRSKDAQAAGVKVVNFAPYTGLAVLLEDSAGTVVVKAGLSVDGPFPLEITMEQADEFVYPASDQMHIIYCAPALEITVTGSAFRVFLKS